MKKISLNHLIMLWISAMFLFAGCEALPVEEPGTTRTLATYMGPLALDNSQWSLASLNGHELVQGSKVSLNVSENTINGNGSCNRYNGRFAIENDTIDITNLTSTRLGCKFLAQEHEYFDALKAVSTYTLTDEHFTLSDAQGNAALVFAPTVHLPLEETQWQLAFYYRPESMVSARAEYSIESGQLTIGPPIATRMACEGDIMEQENAVLENLAQAVTYTIQENKLILTNGGGQAVLEFRAKE